MPITKNAIMRYKILDELLSDRYRNYTLDDLTNEVNRRLAEMRPDGDCVVRRTIEKDIHFLENEGPFWVEIERYSVDYDNYERNRTYRKQCLRYTDPSFSIFKQKLSSEEQYLLRELFSLLGQFDGLPKLEGLERLRQSLRPSSTDQPIISLTKNPLENTNLFGELFTAISQRQVIELHYHQFTAPDNDRVYNLHPYLLRQYNGRWYLFAKKVENDKLKCFPLDRMDKIVPLPSLKYKEYDGNLNELFEDVIGVSIYEAEPVNQIVFWVSDFSVDYVMTKPLHESQKNLNMEEAALRKAYPSLQGGRFFRIDCKRNYELIRELCSYGQELVVLEPTDIRKEIEERIKGMSDRYLSCE
jgi:predicted DNA-binding transcriptional regulator YafY